VLSGNHFAVIKPDPETRWLKFHDNSVTPVTDKGVLEDNYGGESTNKYMPDQAEYQQVMAIKRSTTAYMLVYIRDSRINEVLAPLAEADTPIYLSAFSVPSLTI
jgi:ubiquitin carboxyl-terminal hydrolase 7